MNYISNFLHYLFAPVPGPHFKFLIPTLVLAGILIAAGVTFSEIYRRKKLEDFAFKRLFKKVSGRLVAFGILFIFLVAVRFENIPYFAMRIWIYLGLIILAYAFYHYLRIYIKIYPVEKLNAAKKGPSIRSKYLPNK